MQSAYLHKELLHHHGIHLELGTLSHCSTRSDLRSGEHSNPQESLLRWPSPHTDHLHPACVNKLIIQGWNASGNLLHQGWLIRPVGLWSLLWLNDLCPFTMPDDKVPQLNTSCPYGQTQQQWELCSIHFKGCHHHQTFPSSVCLTFVIQSSSISDHGYDYQSLWLLALSLKYCLYWNSPPPCVSWSLTQEPILTSELATYL